MSRGEETGEGHCCNKKELCEHPDESGKENGERRGNHVCMEKERMRCSGGEWEEEGSGELEEVDVKWIGIEGLES